MTLTPAQRRLRARAASYASWANTRDRSARTLPARRALYQRFLDQCDGDHDRAEAAYRSHFVSLALKSSQARRRAS